MKIVLPSLRRHVVLHAPLQAAQLLTAAVLFFGGVSAARAQNCPAPANWFPHAQTQPPNPNVFPGNDTATDCDFHLWAWQTFLYLTQENNGRPRFLSYPTETDLFPTNPTLKPLASDALMATKASTPAPLKLKVRSAKPKEGGQVENPGSIFQAGSHGILIGQDGNPLFYSVHFSPTFYNFVESNGYYDYATFIKAPPTTNFPPGSLELKAAWMIVPAGSTPTGYTVQAEVPTLSTDNKGDIVAGEPYRQVTVALVGLHVVGVVANHPEFIWASFENVNNAPDLPSSIPPNSTEPVSATGFTFYKANTLANQCNVIPKTVTLNAQAQTLSPATQVFRQYTEGGGAPPNLAAIYTLNQSVQAQLAPTDPCKAYNLIGGVWLLAGALQPNQQPYANMLHGSFNLASSVMETFAQTPFATQLSTEPTPIHTQTIYLTSCFGCHNTEATKTHGGLPIPPMNMNLSHILTEGLVTRQAALMKLKAAER